MPILASEILSEASTTYLNDSTRGTWTDAVLLPSLKTAYDQLRLALVAVDAPVIDETTTAALTINALATEVPTIADLLYPIKVWERGVGDSEDAWSVVTERDWEPESVSGGMILNWKWAEDAIKVRPANVARQVKVYYKRDLSAIIDANSAVNLTLAKTYLAAKTAALAAGLRGNNPTRAMALDAIAESEKERYTGIIVKRMQVQGVRRQSYSDL